MTPNECHVAAQVAADTGEVIAELSSKLSAAGDTIKNITEQLRIARMAAPEFKALARSLEQVAVLERQVQTLELLLSTYEAPDAAH